MPRPQGESPLIHFVLVKSCWWVQSAWWCTGICKESKGIGEVVPIHCTTTTCEITIVGGWGWRISDIAEDTMVGWDEFNSGWIVGTYGKACGYYSSTTNPSLLYHGVFAPRSPVSFGNQEKEVLSDTKWSG
jgi:hypothetical protein